MESMLHLPIERQSGFGGWRSLRSDVSSVRCRLFRCASKPFLCHLPEVPLNEIVVKESLR